MSDLNGKTAIVTGASRGIGKAIAVHLARQGAFVVIVNKNPEAGQKAANELKASGGECMAVSADLSHKEDCERVIETVITARGQIDILVNNAGITADNLLIRMKDEEWSSVINANLNSVFYLSRAAVKHMIKARKGRIINISSVVGHSGNAGQVNYSAAKSALIGFSKSLAKEIAPRNITCNVVSPGFIETDMTAKLNDAQRETITKNIPLGRIGTADDIAAAVAFLASDGASYITGTALHVNGGLY